MINYVWNIWNIKKKLVTIIYFFKININPIYEINKKNIKL